MDLGARPVKVFFVITRRAFFPRDPSGWLLAFTSVVVHLFISLHLVPGQHAVRWWFSRRFDWGQPRINVPGHYHHHRRDPMIVGQLWRRSAPMDSEGRSVPPLRAAALDWRNCRASIAAEEVTCRYGGRRILTDPAEPAALLKRARNRK